MIDLDALAGVIADQLTEPTYCLNGDGFVRFYTRVDSRSIKIGFDERTVRAEVTLVSDGEDEVTFAPEAVEISVRRVPGRVQ